MSVSPTRGPNGRFQVLSLTLCGLLALGFLWSRQTSDAGLESAEYQRVSAVVDRETYASMKPIHRRMLAQIVEETVKRNAPFAATCWQTDPQNNAVVEAFNAAITGGLSQLGADFQLGSRWSNTATNGGGLGQGDPMTLTYSFAPDGTTVPSGVGEGSGTSNLFAWLNGIYTSASVWQNIFHEEFDRWSDLTGVTYVHETNDDGASFFGASGILNVRGDVRISAKAIDGNSGTLAYNFFPNGGDMVLDSADSFYNTTSNNSRRLRNVISHEHGHGLGLFHVCPGNGTKLMEPFINTNFLGPQLDEIQGGQRHYGDRFEQNDTAAQATDLGSPADGTFTLVDLSTDDNSDDDWFKFTVFGSKSVSATVRPIGATYLTGSQVSPCSGGGSSFDSLNVSNLALELIDSDGSTVLLAVDSGGIGQSETITNFTLPGSGTFYVRVVPDNTNSVQLYELDFGLQTIGTPPFTISYPSGIPAEVVTGQTNLVDIFVFTLPGQVLDPNNTSLVYSIDGQPEQTASLIHNGGGSFQAELPGLDCFERLDWYVIFNSTLGVSQASPNGAPGIRNTTSGDGGNPTTFFADSFTNNEGWTVTNQGGLTDGAWNRGTPVGGGARGDPAIGLDADNTCYLTDNASGNSDVDNGATILTSPVFDLSFELDAIFSFAFWYDNDFGGNPNEDSFKIEISDDGVNWVRIETYNASINQWIEREVRISEFVNLTANVQLRFIADDLFNGSVVEAGVDAFLCEVCERSVFGPCGVGLAGAFNGSGSPFDVLLVNSSAGGVRRVVEVPMGQAITFEMTAVPGSTTVGQFAIAGRSGIPFPGEAFPLGLFQGTLCFTPCIANPTDPALFMLADNLTGNPSCPSLLPSTPAPWQLTIPGLNFPFTISLQGVIIDNLDFRVTNAVAIDNF
ncbi:MAG: matrixin family metalloprotease [Planctomycetota bacterium]